MKAQDRDLLIKDFILDHADRLQLQEHEIKKWIDDKYLGAYSGHNDLYNAKNLIKIFLKYTSNKVYELNEEKILDYLGKNEKDLIELFKEKRKEMVE